MQVGVVGRVHRSQLLQRDRRPPNAAVEFQGVLHGRVGLEQHALLKSVEVDACYERPFLGQHRLPLN